MTGTEATIVYCFMAFIVGVLFGFGIGWTLRKDTDNEVAELKETIRQLNIRRLNNGR